METRPGDERKVADQHHHRSLDRRRRADLVLVFSPACLPPFFAPKTKFIVEDRGTNGSLIKGPGFVLCED